MSRPAPIIVSALFGPADFARFESLRRRYYPPEHNRVVAHLTLFRHLPPSVAPELAQRLVVETRGVAAPSAKAAGLISLGSGVAVKIESPDLVDIREQLAEAFVGLLMPQDTADWRPHVTIQNKAAPGSARDLLGELRGSFRPCPVAIVGLASWYYRDGSWEPIGRYMFA